MKKTKRKNYTYDLIRVAVLCSGISYYPNQLRKYRRLYIAIKALGLVLCKIFKLQNEIGCRNGDI